MSETTFGLVESLHERPPGTVGKPRLHPDARLENAARVVDDDGRDVGVGEVGELIFRNAMTMKGYFDDPERTREAIRDGWLYTGDYAQRGRERLLLVRRPQEGHRAPAGRERLARSRSS